MSSHRDAFLGVKGLGWCLLGWWDGMRRVAIRCIPLALSVSLLHSLVWRRILEG